MPWLINPKKTLVYNATRPRRKRYKVKKALKLLPQPCEICGRLLPLKYDRGRDEWYFFRHLLDRTTTKMRKCRYDCETVELSEENAALIAERVIAK